MNDTLELEIVNDCGVPRCPRCGGPVNPDEYNAYRAIQVARKCRVTNHSGLALYCRPCVLRHALDNYCRRYVGVSYETKCRMWENQGRCCALCSHPIQLERPPHNEHTQWYAVVDHKRGPNNTSKTLNQTGAKVKPSFIPGDMVRAVLCAYCNLFVGLWEKCLVTGDLDLLIHPKVVKYVSEWNERYDLWIASNPVHYQQTLDIAA